MTKKEKYKTQKIRIRGRQLKLKVEPGSFALRMSLNKIETLTRRNPFGERVVVAWKIPKLLSQDYQIWKMWKHWLESDLK